MQELTHSTFLKSYIFEIILPLMQAEQDTWLTSMIANKLNGTANENKTDMSMKNLYISWQ